MQRQTYLYVCEREGETNAQTDLNICPNTSFWNYVCMDSGHLISKAVFAVQASYAKELTMQPCSLDMGDKYPSLQISRSSSIQVLSNASSDLKPKEERKLMIPALIYGPHSKQEKFH